MRTRIFLTITVVFAAVVGMNQTVTAETLVAALDFSVAVGSNSVPDLSGNGFYLTVGTAGAIETGGKFGVCLTNTAGQTDAVKGRVGYILAAGGGVFSLYGQNRSVATEIQLIDSVTPFMTGIGVLMKVPEPDSVSPFGHCLRKFLKKHLTTIFHNHSI